MGQSPMRAKVGDPAGERADGAQIRVARASKANHFTPNPILLGCEGEGAEGGSRELLVGGRSKGEARGSRKELNVTQGEGGGLRRAGGVLAGAEQKEKGQDDHVSSGERTGKVAK